MVNIEDPPTAESIVHRKFGVLMTTEATIKIPIPTTSGFHNFAFCTLIFALPNILSSPACQPIMTSIMQNKANFRKSQMNVNLYNTTDYENKWQRTLGENKANTKPIKANLPDDQMNVNKVLTKDYRKNDDFAVQKNKPNSKPISEKPKMNVNLYVIEDYENETAFRLEQNKPNQSQFQTRSEFIPKGAEIPTGELLGILKPGTNFKRGAKTHLLKISCPTAQTFLCWGHDL